jgi:hypothetical protein
MIGGIDPSTGEIPVHHSAKKGLYMRSKEVRTAALG